MVSIGSAAAPVALPVAVLGIFLANKLYLRNPLFSSGTYRQACLGAQEDRLIPLETRAGALQNNHDHTYQGSACPARLAAACPREPLDTLWPGAPLPESALGWSVWGGKRRLSLRLRPTVHSASSTVCPKKKQKPCRVPRHRLRFLHPRLSQYPIFFKSYILWPPWLLPVLFQILLLENNPHHERAAGTHRDVLPVPQVIQQNGKLVPARTRVLK